MQEGYAPTGSASPATAPQIAQTTPSGEAIGQITELIGAASVTRGVDTQALTVGAPVLLDDLVATRAGGSLTITFLDGTVFSLSNDARIVVDSLVFNPGGTDNQLLISLLHGTFAFVSGAISDNFGPGLRIETPVGGIGVRGTAGVGDYDLVRLLITLLQGEVIFSNNVASALLGTVFQTLNVGSAEQQDLTVFNMTSAEQTVYDDLLPRILERVGPEAGEAPSDGEAPAEGLGVEPVDPDVEVPGGEAGVDFGAGERNEPLEPARQLAEEILRELGRPPREDPNVILNRGGPPGPGEPPPGGGPDGANLSTGVGARPAGEIEALLGLGLGSLSGLGNGPATEADAAPFTFALSAGDVLSFAVNYLTNEDIVDGAGSDFAFYSFDNAADSIALRLVEIADSSSDFLPSDSDFAHETGFQTVEIVAPSSGLFRLGLGVADSNDAVIDSGLLVRDFEVLPGEPPIIGP